MKNFPFVDKHPGAGVVVVKKFPTGFKVLGLFDQRNRRRVWDYTA
jgi:hypothetical protein